MRTAWRDASTNSLFPSTATSTNPTNCGARCPKDCASFDPPWRLFPTRRGILGSVRDASDAECCAKIVLDNAARPYDFDLEYLANKRVPRAAD
jgi:hypothetical protein